MPRQNLKLVQRNKILKKECHNKKRQVTRLKRKILHLKEVIADLKKRNLLSDKAVIDLERSICGIPQALMKRYVNNLKRGKVSRKKYPEELRSFALTLNFYSVKAYEYVRKTFGFCLPSQSVIRNWYSKIDCSPGYCVPAFDILKEKVLRSIKWWK